MEFQLSKILESFHISNTRECLIEGVSLNEPAWLAKACQLSSC